MKNKMKNNSNCYMSKWEFFDKICETFFSFNQLEFFQKCLDNRFGTLTNKETSDTWKYSCNEIADKFILVKVL